MIVDCPLKVKHYRGDLSEVKGSAGFSRHSASRALTSHPQSKIKSEYPTIELRTAEVLFRASSSIDAQASRLDWGDRGLPVRLFLLA
jgi:hypothetical protein